MRPPAPPRGPGLCRTPSATHATVLTQCVCRGLVCVCRGRRVSSQATGGPGRPAGGGLADNCRWGGRRAGRIWPRTGVGEECPLRQTLPELGSTPQTVLPDSLFKQPSSGILSRHLSLPRKPSPDSPPQTALPIRCSQKPLPRQPLQIASPHSFSRPDCFFK